MPRPSATTAARTPRRADRSRAGVFAIVRPGGAGLVVALLALAAACASPAPPPPDASWVARVEALVDAWPVERYAISDRGRPVGRMTLRQSVVEQDGEAVLLLEDVARVADPEGGDDPVDYAWTAACRLDDHFTPRVVEAQAPARADTPTWSRVEVRDGRATGATFESAVDLAVPARFTIRQALMRLVALLPRELGAETELAVLSLGAEPRVERARTVRCTGLEELVVGGRRMPAWRYEYASAEGGAARRVALWVAEDGRVLRFHDPAGLQLELTDA